MAVHAHISIARLSLGGQRIGEELFALRLDHFHIKAFGPAGFSELFHPGRIGGGLGKDGFDAVGNDKIGGVLNIFVGHLAVCADALGRANRNGIASREIIKGIMRRDEITL